MILLLMFSMTSLCGEHKFYISKTMIDYNSRTAEFEITCKLFTEDLELAIGGERAGDMRLGTEHEAEDANQRVEKYLHEHLALKFNGAPMEWRWVGMEVESDLTFCYAEFYRQPDFATMEVFNDILMAQFADQQNIVDLTMSGTTQTHVFNGNLVRQEFRR